MQERLAALAQISVEHDVMGSLENKGKLVRAFAGKPCSKRQNRNDTL